MQALMPHQAIARDLMAVHDRFWLCDDPGLGKTRATIEALIQRKANHVLWITPRSAVYSIAEEFERWADEQWAPPVVYKNVMKEDPDVIVVPWSALQTRKALSGLRAWCKDHKPHVVIDEFHWAKNPGALRTKQVFGFHCDRAGGLVEHASAVYCLSGTPITNHAGELWPSLRALAPDLLGGALAYHHFLSAYTVQVQKRFNGHIVWQVVGTQLGPFEQLAGRMKPWTLRRHVEDVLAWLPSLTWRLAQLEGHDIDKAILNEALAGDSKLAFAYREYFAAKLAYRRDPYDERLSVQMDRAAAAALERLDSDFSTVRRLIGQSKAEPSAEYVSDLLEGGAAKVLVFAHHKDTIKALHSALGAYGAVAVTGDTSQRDWEMARLDWQRPDAASSKLRVMICAMDKVSEAVTLHAHGLCRDVVFVEYPTSPAKMLQCAKRAHRIGQPNAVTAHVLAIKHSMDAAFAKLLVRKQEAEAVFDNAVIGAGAGDKRLFAGLAGAVGKKRPKHDFSAFALEFPDFDQE